MHCKAYSVTGLLITLQDFLSALEHDQIYKHSGSNKGIEVKLLKHKNTETNG